MGGLKTHRTAESVDAVIENVTDEVRRQDCMTLIRVIGKVTGVAPTVWSNGVIGFGTYHYRYPSGQEGEWFPVGFAPRKTNLTVYLGPGLEYSEDLLSKLGKYKAGKGCLYIKRVDDVDLAVLEELVADSFARINQMYGCV